MQHIFTIYFENLPVRARNRVFYDNTSLQPINSAKSRFLLLYLGPETAFVRQYLNTSLQLRCCTILKNLYGRAMLKGLTHRFDLAWLYAPKNS